MNIKAADLVIGDLVMDGDNVAKITGVKCDGTVETTVSQQSNITLISPIPLTGEFLLFNNFKKLSGDNGIISGEYYFPFTGNSIYKFVTVSIIFYNGDKNMPYCLVRIDTKNSDGTGMNSIHNCDTKSVNQFQHLLRDCNLDCLSDNLSWECKTD